MFSGWIVRWNEARAYQHASMPAHIASTRRGPFERTYVSRARQRSLRSVVDFKLVRGRQSRSGMRWRSAGSRGAPRPPSRLYPTSARPSFRGSIKHTYTDAGARMAPHTLHSILIFLHFSGNAPNEMPKRADAQRLPDGLKCVLCFKAVRFCPNLS